MLEPEQFLVNINNVYTEEKISTIISSRIELADFLKLLEHPGLKGKYQISKIKIDPYFRDFEKTIVEFSKVVEKFRGQKQPPTGMEFGR